ncbi:hypothetical protein H9P43_003309 [Blastocladiella emersonii ATCC 22665]|nr:hypothetical protein H9P43_003309 [Blastocladiella emersonii ATCC 22665]
MEPHETDPPKPPAPPLAASASAGPPPPPPPAMPADAERERRPPDPAAPMGQSRSHGALALGLTSSRSADASAVLGQNREAEENGQTLSMHNIDQLCRSLSAIAEAQRRAESDAAMLRKTPTTCERDDDRERERERDRDSGVTTTTTDTWRRATQLGTGQSTLDRSSRSASAPLRDHLPAPAAAGEPVSPHSALALVTPMAPFTLQPIPGLPQDTPPQSPTTEAPLDSPSTPSSAFGTGRRNITAPYAPISNGVGSSYPLATGSPSGTLSKVVLRSRSRSMAKSVTLSEAPTPPMLSRSGSMAGAVSAAGGNAPGGGSPASSHRASRSSSFFTARIGGGPSRSPSGDAMASISTGAAPTSAPAAHPHAASNTRTTHTHGPPPAAAGISPSGSAGNILAAAASSSSTGAIPGTRQATIIAAAANANYRSPGTTSSGGSLTGSVRERSISAMVQRSGSALLSSVVRSRSKSMQPRAATEGEMSVSGSGSGSPTRTPPIKSPASGSAAVLCASPPETPSSTLPPAPKAAAMPAALGSPAAAHGSAVLSVPVISVSGGDDDAGDSESEAGGSSNGGSARMLANRTAGGAPPRLNASSRSLGLSNPSIRITPTVREEEAHETVEFDLDDDPEPGDRGDRMANTDDDDEEEGGFGVDRYYDPDEDDDGDDPHGSGSGSSGVRIVGPGRDREAGTSSSRLSLRQGPARPPHQQQPAAPARPSSAAVADPSIDPLASARNLFLSTGDEYGQQPHYHQAGRGNGEVGYTAPLADGDGGQYSSFLQASRKFASNNAFASNNFISRMESRDVVWDTGQQPKAKFVGPYLLGDVIGKGSFGKVKDGMCSELLQPVAVKIVAHKRLRKIQFGIEAVTHEIQTLRRIRGHPNVVRLLDVFAKVEDDDGNEDTVPWTATEETEMGYKVHKRYLVFEYCHGNLQSLLDAAPDGKIPLHQVQDYMIQLIDGLEYLHARHIVHRDIKPANLLLTLDGVLKISDFGVAEVLTPYDGTDQCQNFAGTHQYMSPEVAAGEMHPSGEKVDVWASGVTLYNMAFGDFPFDLPGSNVMGLYEQIKQADMDLPADAHPDLAALLRMALAKDPAARATLHAIRKHAFLNVHPSDLAEGPYVPLPTLTADAAMVHAAVTLGRGKGEIARPVSPRTLSRGGGAGAAAGGSAGSPIFPPPPPVLGRPTTPNDVPPDDDDRDTKLPYSLFPALEPMFPELAQLSLLPPSASSSKGGSTRGSSRRGSQGSRRNSSQIVPLPPPTQSAGTGKSRAQGILNFIKSAASRPGSADAKKGRRGGSGT